MHRSYYGVMCEHKIIYGASQVTLPDDLDEILMQQLLQPESPTILGNVFDEFEILSS